MSILTFRSNLHLSGKVKLDFLWKPGSRSAAVVWPSQRVGRCKRRLEYCYSTGYNKCPTRGRLMTRWSFQKVYRSMPLLYTHALRSSDFPSHVCPVYIWYVVWSMISIITNLSVDPNCQPPQIAGRLVSATVNTWNLAIFQLRVYIFSVGRASSLAITQTFQVQTSRFGPHFFSA